MTINILYLCYLAWSKLLVDNSILTQQHITGLATYDLKVEPFNHTNISQLNTYVNYFKQEIMMPDDNPPVGILLVTDKNSALVEYATAGVGNQLFVSKYQLQLPTKDQLADFVKEELKKL